MKTEQKANKDYICCKCNKEIKKGSKYIKKAYYLGRYPKNNELKILCTQCGN